MNKTSGRIIEIDALRGFAIFIVVLYHSVIRFPINLFVMPPYSYLVQWCFSFHMPLFFAISGFCFSCRDYREYMRKKISRLVVPYLIFSVIDMIPRQLLPSLVNRPRPMTESIIQFLLYGGEFWFIYTLFVIFVIYPFIFRLVRSDKWKMILLLVFFFVLAHHGVRVNLFCIYSAAYYIFFFHLGVTIRTISGGWPEIKVPAFVLPVMFVLWLVSLYSTEGLGVSIALMGIFTCYLMTRYKVFNDAFARFGGYSLQIYLVNGVALGTSRGIIYNVLHIQSHIAIILFNVLIDFFAAYIFIKYVCAKSKTLRLAMGIV